MPDLRRILIAAAGIVAIVMAALAMVAHGDVTSQLAVGVIAAGAGVVLVALP